MIPSHYYQQYNFIDDKVIDDVSKNVGFTGNRIGNLVTALKNNRKHLKQSQLLFFVQSIHTDYNRLKAIEDTLQYLEKCSSETISYILKEFDTNQNKRNALEKLGPKVWHWETDKQKEIIVNVFSSSSDKTKAKQILGL